MSSSTALIDRFAPKVSAPSESDCWEWVAARLARGYGVLERTDGGSRLAHRISYELFVGPIPEGFVIDHLCRNTSCVNPTHLEPVTQRVNLHRGDTGLATGARQRAKTHCPVGHEYTPENTYRDKVGKRSCRSCTRTRQREAKRVKRGSTA